jgi:hypothetical protein
LLKWGQEIEHLHLESLPPRVMSQDITALVGGLGIVRLIVLLPEPYSHCTRKRCNLLMMDRPCTAHFVRAAEFAATEQTPL